MVARQHTFPITPTGEGSLSFQVAARATATIAGASKTTATNNPSTRVDTVAPVVTITGVPNGFTGPVTTTVTFDQSEYVLGFEDADITVTCGTLGPITGRRQVWTAQVMVNATGDVTVGVAGAAVQDASGTPRNAASVTGTIASGTDAEGLIRDFLGARGQALIAAQPSLSGLRNKDGPSGNIQVSRGQGIAQIQTGTKGPIWAALDANWSDIDGFQTAYTHLTFGAMITAATRRFWA